MPLTEPRATRRWPAALRRRTALRTGAAVVLTAGSLTVAGLGTASATTTPSPSASPSTGLKAPVAATGSVKIHASDTPVGDPTEQTRVCRFYLDATGFKPETTVITVIAPWLKKKVVSHFILHADGNGAAHTKTITLPNGHYALAWGTLDQREPNLKQFWVICTKPSPTPTSASPTPTPSPTGTPAPVPTPVRTDLPVTG